MSVIAAPYIVLDQNVLRKPELLAAIERARRTGAGLLVLDVAVLEMTKHPVDWEDTIRRSLAQLVGCRGLVVLGRGVSDLMREERSSGLPAFGALADFERTPGFRDLIKELQPPAGGPNLEHLRANIADTRTRISEAQYLQHADNKQKLVGFRDAWKAWVPNSGDRQRVRASTADQLRLLISPTMTCEIEPILTGQGVAPLEAQRIAYDRSVHSHWMLGLRAIALRWFLQHGLDSLAAEKATNEVLDLDYITVGSLCSELVSIETTVRETAALVRAAAGIRAAMYAQVQQELPDADAESRFNRLREVAKATANLIVPR